METKPLKNENKKFPASNRNHFISRLLVFYVNYMYDLLKLNFLQVIFISPFKKNCIRNPRDLHFDLYQNNLSLFPAPSTTDNILFYFPLKCHVNRSQ